MAKDRLGWAYMERTLKQGPKGKRFCSQQGGRARLVLRQHDMHVLCFDDVIFIGPCSKESGRIIKELQRIFNLTDKGAGEGAGLSEYLGIKVPQLSEGKISLTYSHLIDNTIADNFLRTPRPNRFLLACPPSYKETWMELILMNIGTINQSLKS
jgi:hypothetical protein